MNVTAAKGMTKQLVSASLGNILLKVNAVTAQSLHILSSITFDK